MGFTRTVCAHCLSDRGLILHVTVTSLGRVCQAKLLRLFQLSGPKPWKELPPVVQTFSSFKTPTEVGGSDRCDTTLVHKMRVSPALLPCRTSVILK